MLSLRSRLFIFISIGILVLLAIALFLLYSGRAKKAAEALQTGATDTAQNNSANNIGFDPAKTGQAIQKPSPVVVDQNVAKQIARIFIERYGSYSGLSEFKNVLEVQELVTPELWKDLKKIMQTSLPKTTVGITTKVVTVDVMSYNNKEAQVRVRAIRSAEEKGGARDYYIVTTVKLLKQDNRWLVNSFDALK